MALPTRHNVRRVRAFGRSDWIVVAGLSATLLVLLGSFLWIVPVSHPFSLWAAPGGGEPVFSPIPGILSPPKGAEVAGSWSSVPGSTGPTWLSIYSADGTPVYTSLGPSGSFNFVAQDPPYVFVPFGQAITAQGTVAYPVL